MKATGIVRRIVIPKEIRRTLHIREGDPLELFLDRDGICLQKYSALGILSDDDLRVAHTMANRSNLHPIAIYDTTVKPSGGKTPLFVLSINGANTSRWKELTFHSCTVMTLSYTLTQ